MPIKLTAAPLSADDRFAHSETAATGILILDVRANDGKYSTKALYSLDDGQSADLAAGDPIGAILDRSALGATISITASGTVAYNSAAIQPLIDALAPGQTLEDSFLYPTQTSTTAGQWSTVRITFTGTNDVPVAAADVAALAEGSVASGNVGSNDRDVDNGALLSFAPTAGLQPAGFSMSSSGAWTFNANDTAYDSLAPGEVKTVVVNYTVTDQYGASAGSSLTIKVTGTNDAPVAQPASAAVAEDAQAAGQLSATDPDAGAVLSYAITGAAPAGFALAGNGAWSFDAAHSAYQGLAAGQVQTVVVNYTVTDQYGASSASTLTLRITGTNDGPIAQATSAGVSEDAQATGQLSASDADAGAVLSYAIAGDAPAGFALAANGAWTFDSAHSAYQSLAAGQVQTVVLNYTATDQQGASSASTLTLRITGTNDGPTAQATSAGVSEDAQATGQLIASDADAGAVLSYAITGDAPAGFALAANGAWTFNASDSSYQGLAAGQVQTIVVNYSATDQHGASSASTLTLDVTGANDAPVAQAAGAGVAEDAQIAGQLSATDADSGAVLSYVLSGEAPAGFALGANGAWTFDASNSAYQGLAAGQVQTLVVYYTATDQHGASSASSLTVNVTGTNDAPSARAESAAVAEAAQTAGQLSANDADAGAVLSYAIASDAPAGFTLATDGAWSFDATHPSYDSLAAGQVQTVAVNYTVTDQYGANSASTLTVRITGTNDAPLAQAASYAVAEDNHIAGQLSATDPDAGAVLSYAVSGGAPAGFAIAGNGAWTFDAAHSAYQELAAGQVQSIVVNYTATDQFGASSASSLTVTVTGTNDAPLAQAASAAVAEDNQIAGQLSATDPDADAVLAYAVSGQAPAGFALADNGAWTFDASGPVYQGLAVGEVQTIVVNYTATDLQGASSNSSLTLAVTGTNDAPVAHAASVRVDEDAQAAGQLGASDGDAGAILSYAICGDSPAGFALAANGTWTFDAADSAYQSLAAGQVQTVVVDYAVTDQFAASGASSLTVNVTGANDAPVAQAASAAVTENAQIAGQLSASDADAGAVLGYAIAGDAPAGFALAANGAWTFDATHPSYDSLAAGQVRTVAVDYIVADEFGAGSASTLTVYLTGTNDAPVAEAASAAVAEDAQIAGQLGAGDADAGASLSYAVVGDAPAGFVLGTNGSWSFDANQAVYQSLAPGQVQTLVVNYTASDEHGAGSAASLNLTVTGTNDAPAAAAVSASVGEGAQVAGQLSAGDPDSGAVLSYALVGDAPAGFALAADGGWTLDAAHPSYDRLAAGQVQTVVLNYAVTDQYGESSASSLTVNVTGANDGPIHGDTPLVLAGGYEDTPYSFNVAELLAGWSDPDGDALSAGSITVSRGSVRVSGGVVTYTPEADASGPVTISYQVSDAIGASSAATAAFTVAAVNDAAVIGGTRIGSVTEAALGNAGIATASGQLTISDKDDAAVFRSLSGQQSQSGYGTVSLSSSGAWTYSLNNAALAVERLATGQTVTDSFWAVAGDGTQSLITVTVRGANDFTSPSASTALWGDPNDNDNVVQGGWGYAGQVIQGTVGPDRIVANDGPDRIYGKDGNDEIYGFVGRDLIFGDGGDDRLYGQDGDDQILGGLGNDTIYFGSGNDIGSGEAGNDIMYGGTGRDDFSGNDGDDVLIGGWGFDYTQGGAGADRFVYLDLRDTNDVLEDFVFGVDKLDFSALDANAAVAGDQAFAWGGLDPIANGIWMTQVGSTVTFYADTDGNAATAEFMVVLSGTSLPSIDQAPASILF